MEASSERPGRDAVREASSPVSSSPGSRRPQQRRRLDLIFGGERKKKKKKCRGEEKEGAKMAD